MGFMSSRSGLRVKNRQITEVNRSVIKSLLINFLHEVKYVFTRQLSVELGQL